MQINKKTKPKVPLREHLDIRGKVCPMTFVYTKLKLEELNEGDILEVILDFRAAVKKIPENCERQSLAELIEVKEIREKKRNWLLTLKKL
jgi:tRNA 2-thiouridine synthesizing protein A